VSQGGTGSGTSGPAIRKIYEQLYGIRGEKVSAGKAAIAGTKPPGGLPTFARDGSILPPATKESKP
jgi:penicillin-binding protein 2